MTKINEMTLGAMYDRYLKYREMSGLKQSTVIGLKQFYRDCNKYFPSEIYLTKAMVDFWIAKRDTETEYSNRSRIASILAFVGFIHERGWINFDIPIVSKVERIIPIPHAFTEDELKNFFRACDELEDGPTLNVKLKKIEVPVFFRLLFSTGMRTTGGRLLRRENVNLNTGVITIQHTKGYNEHIIVLHDTMRQLLVKYESVICTLIANREYFFPAVNDKCHWNQWVSNCFKEMWVKYNSAKTVPYALRHNYAIENINKWTNTGNEIHDKLVALSKSMGHSTLQGTLYYYSLVPKLHEVIEDLSGKMYNQLIPDLPDEKD